METLLSIVQTVGKPIQMTVNTPFLLNSPQKIWVIAKGVINIYTMKLQEGIPKGKRYYFFSCQAHQILMGFGMEYAQNQIGFLADATEESLLYEIDLSIFQSWMHQEFLKNSVIRLVNEWVENLFYGISENIHHPNQQADVLVKEGEMLILRKGERISAQKNILWSKISAAKADAILVNGISALPDINQDIMLPLTRRSFLQSSRNVGMRFFTTEEALQQESAWMGLKFLDKAIVELESLEMETIQQNERQLLQEKYQNQQKQAQRSLQNVRAVLDKKVQDKYAHTLAIDSENPLFNACQVVMAFQDIQVRMPLEMSETDMLGDICRTSRIRYREVKLDRNWWKKDSGALLGFLKATEEPVALMPIKNQEYEIYNPATQQTVKVNAQNAKEIDNLAYTFFKSFPEKKIGLWELIQFGLRNDNRDVYTLFTMGILATVVGLATPILTGFLFDYVIPHGHKTQLIQLGIALLMLLVGALLFELTESYVLLRIETKMDFRLQSAVWDRLLDLPTAFFRQFTTGDLAERTLGINEIRKILSGIVITTLLASIFSLLNFFLLFYFSVWLALVALGFVLFQIAFTYVLGRWQVSKERLALEHQGKTQGVVLQLLTGIAKFRVTGTEIRAFTHWLGYFSKMKQYAFQAHQIQNIQSTLNSISPLLASALIYTILWYKADSIRLSTGEFLAFYTAFGVFNSAMLAMTGALVAIYQIIPIYDRTRPILETLPESDSGKINPGKLKGKIEVSQIHFRYEKDSPLVLQDVSFRLNSGDYVAFVGASGSGKSTMIRLLLGFEKPESGSIFYDEQELSQLDVRLLRRQIGTVLQDGELSPGDILSNIIGTSPHLTIEDAWEAAKLAGLDEDIKKMPMGMHTIIHEGATTLSGGQRQRLLIAQTLVHKPRIIFFDEATSALDNRTQAIVTNSLNKLQATRIIIAHRLSTIQDVDKIFVFDKGRIVQQGTFEELMAVEGVFKDLAARQIE